MDNKGNEKLDYFSGLFINYLKKQNHWNNTQLIYQFGEEKRATTPKTPASQTQLSDSFITTPLKELNINIATKAGLLWDSKQAEAIEKGNLLHLILSKINTKGILLKGYLKNDFKTLDISNNQKYFGSTDLKNNSICHR